jgi:hypothetical protein
MPRILFLLFGVMLGGSIHFYVDALLNSAKQAELQLALERSKAWESAHKMRDREDEKLTQTMQKILNRIEIFGACPRHFDANKKR